jgi:hypothetical protein
VVALPGQSDPLGLPLGTFGKFAATQAIPDAEAAERRYAILLERFRLQAVAGKLLVRDGFQVAKCLRLPIPGVTTVALCHDLKHQRGGLKQLQVCKSVWSCPVCMSVITERRRDKLRQLIAAARGSGLRVLLLTVTFSHKRWDDLVSILGAFLEALRAMTGARRYRALREEFAVVGWVRALEVTYSDVSGWHPHGHILVFLPREVDFSAYADAFRLLWSEALAKVGLSCNEHGFKWSDTDARVSEYVAKWGHDPRWDADAEMTKIPAKSGRGSSLSPLQLLRMAADGDSQAGALYREYSIAFKGRAQLMPTPGLYELLLGEAAKTDAEVMADSVADMVALLYLRDNASGWRRVLRGDHRAALQHVLSSGDVASVLDFLAYLDVDSSAIVWPCEAGGVP